MEHFILAAEATLGQTYTRIKGNTRFGATFGIALSRRQALRIAYFDGVTARVGSDISSISVAYQVIWHNGR